MQTLSLVFFILLLTQLATAQTKTEIIDRITKQAAEFGVDPDLAVAIATVESSLNPKAVGSLNEQGLFQLRPEYHSLTGGSSDNIRVAIKYLQWLKNKSNGAHGNAWFVLYNWGPYNAPKYPTRTKYYKKVMQQMNRIKSKRFIANN